MGYLLANTRYVIDTSTWQFVYSLEGFGPCAVDIPYYFWEHAKSILKHPDNVLKRTQLIALNNLDVEFTALWRQKGDMAIFDYHTVRLSFIHGGKQETWYLNVNPVFGNTSYSRMTDTQLRGVDYEFWRGDGERQKARSDFFDIEDRPIFERISTLSWVRPSISSVRSCPHFGISHDKYLVWYRSKQLRGSCYALLCGTWAILLDDDFSFDSLVSLKSASDGRLYIDQIMATVNPYVVKIKTLVRQ